MNLLETLSIGVGDQIGFEILVVENIGFTVQNDEQILVFGESNQLLDDVRPPINKMSQIVDARPGQLYPIFEEVELERGPVLNEELFPVQKMVDHIPDIKAVRLSYEVSLEKRSFRSSGN